VGERVQEGTTARLAGRAAVALVTAALAAAGCSRSNEWTKARPPTHVAGGVVTYRGEPVANGLVVFLTNPAYEKWTYGEVAAFGETDSQGHFKLRTFRPGDGAVAGRHKVLVQKVTLKLPNGKPVQPGDLVAPEDGTRPAVDPASLVEFHHLPERYRARDQTPLTAKVTERGPNEFRFEID
jgi:hypothetical protein